MTNLAGRSIHQLHNFAAHPLGDIERGKRKVQLIHVGAQKLHQQPQKEPAKQINLAPHFQVISRRMLVKVPNPRMHHVRVEAGSAEGFKISNQARSCGSTQLQVLDVGNSLIDAGPNAPAVP